MLLLLLLTFDVDFVAFAEAVLVGLTAPPPPVADVVDDDGVSVDKDTSKAI